MCELYGLGYCYLSSGAQRFSLVAKRISHESKSNLGRENYSWIGSRTEFVKCGDKSVGDTSRMCVGPDGVTPGGRVKFAPAVLSSLKFL